jgi:hypothetical protein
VRYQHVMADRDAAIAQELNRLIEAAERRYGTEMGTRGRERRSADGTGRVLSSVACLGGVVELGAAVGRFLDEVTQRVSADEAECEGNLTDRAGPLGLELNGR